jgi:hypothetical protein
MAAEQAHGPAQEAEWLNLTRAAHRLGWPRERLRSLARRGKVQARRGANSGELLVLITPELVARAGSAEGADRGQSARPTHGLAGTAGEAERLASFEALLADAEAQVAGLRAEIARAQAEREATRAVAVADVNAAKMVAEAEIAAAKAEAAAKDQVIAELKALLAEARRPWWRRWLGP